jgi:hypothetical protein
MLEQKRVDWTRAKNSKAALGSETKKGGPAVFPFKVAGSWPKRAGWRPQGASHSGFLAGNFPQGAIPLPNFFAPAFIWRKATGPQMEMPQLKRGKRRSAHVRGHFQFWMVFTGNGS